MGTDFGYGLIIVILIDIATSRMIGNDFEYNGIDNSWQQKDVIKISQWEKVSLFLKIKK